jgi:hypothetical protein
VLLARPKALLEAASSRRVITSVVPDAQLERFAQHTGVDPRRVIEAVWVEHPEGRMMIVRGDLDASLAVREAGERMAPLEASVEAPTVRRAGFLGPRRLELAALGTDTVLWVEGTPQLAAYVLASARRPPDRRRHALEGDRLGDLRAAHDEAHAVLLVPVPLGLPLETGIGILLAQEEALAAAAYPVEDAVRVVVDLRGEFPEGAEQNFRAFVGALAESPLGEVAGVNDALGSLRIQSEEERVVLQLDLDPAQLSRGLRVLLLAELPELLADERVEPPRSEPAPPAL